jgi:acetyl esterase/lipase
MKFLIPLLMAWSCCAIACAAEPNYDRKEDVVYGRKDGMALTLDVFTPKEKANGAAIIHVVSGGWYSNHNHVNPGFAQPFLDRGYTVFAVVHGSQPKYTILDAMSDMNRAVRFIRFNAKTYNIDPDRIGITGASAGGHLSCMQGVAGNAGNPKSTDPVDAVSSRVQAVACFFPPTDFLNYGKEGENAMGRGILKDFHPPFDFQEFDNAKKEFESITDEAKLLEIAHLISPVYHATADDPPTLIIHGDADFLVPIQQAQLLCEKLKAVNVPNELVVRPGKGHGWAELPKDISILADWFDKHLATPPAKPEAAK